MLDAHREKDRQFVAALLDAELLDVTVLHDRVDLLPSERGTAHIERSQIAASADVRWCCLR